jgi:hypothetical protein
VIYDYIQELVDLTNYSKKRVISVITYKKKSVITIYYNYKRFHLISYNICRWMAWPDEKGGK